MKDKIYKLTFIFIFSITLILFIGMNKSYVSAFYSYSPWGAIHFAFDYVTDSGTARDDIETAKNLIDFFTNNPVGTCVTNLLDDILIPVFGDLPQMGANAITFTNTTFEFYYDELETYTDLNEYTKVGEFVEKDEAYKYQVLIKDDAFEGEEKKKEDIRFKKKTKIPVIETDLYDMSMGTAGILNINFFEGSEEQENTPWKYLRNFTAGVIKACIYISIAFSITALIYSGVQIIRNSISNPRAKREHLEAIQRLAVSVIMLVGTVVVMALAIYGGQMIFSDLRIHESKEFPIRVNVEEAGYSFSTNITGYMKYRSKITGINNYREKLKFALFYIVLAWSNLIFAIIMLLRLFVVLFLSIVGILIVTLHIVNIDWPMRYRTWLIIYICLVIIPIVFALIYRLFLLAYKLA